MNIKIQKKVIYIHETDSSNNYANRQLIEGEVSEGTVFLAHAQNKGRGQLNNSWESTPGMNLTFSIVFKPLFLDIQDQFMLSKVVCLGIWDSLRQEIDELRIKWPNDIYVGNRKLAGILIENSIMSGRITNSIVGVGLNVNQTTFTSNAPNPVSLAQITGKHFDLEKLLDDIVMHIFEYYSILANGQFDLINQLFQENMYRQGEMHAYRCGDEVFMGAITGVNEIGQLMLADEQGELRKFHFKEVEFIL